MNEQIAINMLNAELQQMQGQLVLMQAKVADAATPTGNAGADKALGEMGQAASNTINMLTRQIATRTAMVADLTAQLAQQPVPDPAADEAQAAANATAAKLAAAAVEQPAPAGPAFVINADNAKGG